MGVPDLNPSGVLHFVSDSYFLKSDVFWKWEMGKAHTALHACVDLRSELVLFLAREFDVFEFLCKNDCSKKPYFLYFSNLKRHNYISFG